MSVRIVIADDHGLFRAGLSALLNAEPGLQVVGEAADGDEALCQVCALRPDVLVLDTGMPGPGAVEVTRRLQATAPRMRVVLLASSRDDSLLQKRLRAGAHGHIVKWATETDLFDAVRTVCRGHLYVHPSVMRALIGDLIEGQPPGVPEEPLTPRAREVLEKLAQGYTNREIAEEWTISMRTVESHWANLMAKLNLHSRAEIVRYAADNGYL